MSDSTISLSTDTAALMQALDSVLEQMGELKDAVFQVNSNFKFNAHNSLEDCKATREVWHYLLENSGDFADQKDVFMEKVELLNTKNKKYYFVIPEAKNDEALRNEIKEYGAYWENKKQAWVLFCRENDEIPEFFNKFQQLKARELPNYTKKYFTVNHPRLLSEKLKKFGCQYDRKEYSWFILVQEKDKKLPEDLQKFINENS